MQDIAISAQNISKAYRIWRASDLPVGLKPNLNPIILAD
jgi:hypothetical protein